MLEWDSKFFGFGVGRIDDPNRSLEEVPALLEDLKSRGARLVYWGAARAIDDSVADVLGGILADRKTTYTIDFRAAPPSAMTSTAPVTTADESIDRTALESLAVQSGKMSRFAVDPRFPNHLYVAIYRRWIQRSLAKELADEVLVLEDGSIVAGMVTLGDHEGRGDIGLIAVDARFRGRGYGEMLVRAAGEWFVERGYSRGRVVTQGANTAACRLYEKCGYTVESVVHLYHFWI